MCVNQNILSFSLFIPFSHTQADNMPNDRLRLICDKFNMKSLLLELKGNRQQSKMRTSKFKAAK